MTSAAVLELHSLDSVVLGQNKEQTNYHEFC
jgi:hypothetical protein